MKLLFRMILWLFLTNTIMHIIIHYIFQPCQIPLLECFQIRFSNKFQYYSYVYFFLSVVYSFNFVLLKLFRSEIDFKVLRWVFLLFIMFISGFVVVLVNLSFYHNGSLLFSLAFSKLIEGLYYHSYFLPGILICTFLVTKIVVKKPA